MLQKENNFITTICKQVSDNQIRGFQSAHAISTMGKSVRLWVDVSIS